MTWCVSPADYKTTSVLGLNFEIVLWGGGAHTHTQAHTRTHAHTHTRDAHTYAHTVLPPVLVPTHIHHDVPSILPPLPDDTTLPENVILPSGDPPHVFPGNDDPYNR